jgi:hypothetical protein
MRTLCIALTALALLSLAVPAGAGDWQGREVEKDGVLHVMNPSDPTEPPVEVDLSQRWRLGGETEDEDEFFGVIMQIATDAKGNVYLLDSQLAQVMVYTSEGEFVRTIGREGDGPGEFRRPGDMLILPDGNIGVVQMMPGKIVVLTPEGDPVGNQPVPGDDDGTQFFMGARPAGDHFVLGVTYFSRGDDGFKSIFKIIGVNLEGSQTAGYYDLEVKRDFANLVFDEKEMSGFGVRWEVGNDGRVYVNRVFDEYRIDVWNSDGTPDRVITRDYEPRARSAEEIERAGKRFRVVINGREPERKISKTDRDIQFFYPRHDGSLWVLSSRGGLDTHEGILGTFDVYDPNGRLIRQAVVKGEGSIERDGFFFVGDRLYVVTSLVSARMSMYGGGSGMEEDEEDAGPMAVVCYQLGPEGELHGMNR